MSINPVRVKIKHEALHEESSAKRSRVDSNTSEAGTHASFLDLMGKIFPLRAQVYLNLKCEDLLKLMQTSASVYKKLESDSQLWELLLNRDFGKDAVLPADFKKLFFLAYKTNHYIVKELLSKHPTQQINPPAWTKPEVYKGVQIFHLMEAYHQCSIKSPESPEYLNIFTRISHYLAINENRIAAEKTADQLAVDKKIALLLLISEGYQAEGKMDEAKRLLQKAENEKDLLNLPEDKKNNFFGEILNQFIQISDFDGITRVANKMTDYKERFSILFKQAVSIFTLHQKKNFLFNKAIEAARLMAQNDPVNCKSLIDVASKLKDIPSQQDVVVNILEEATEFAQKITDPDKNYLALKAIIKVYVNFYPRKIAEARKTAELILVPDKKAEAVDYIDCIDGGGWLRNLVVPHDAFL